MKCSYPGGAAELTPEMCRDVAERLARDDAERKAAAERARDEERKKFAALVAAELTDRLDVSLAGVHERFDRIERALEFYACKVQGKKPAKRTRKAK